jgi:hypothetical protein
MNKVKSIVNKHNKVGYKSVFTRISKLRIKMVLTRGPDECIMVPKTYNFNFLKSPDLPNVFLRTKHRDQNRAS